MIGNSPKHAPRTAESSAWPIGIEYAISATRIATPSETSAAQWAFIFRPPSRTNSVITGRAAKIAVRNSESPTGSSTCLYIATPS
jgi:hypothetical protein